MPTKVRQLIRELEKAGFVDRGGKGSHRNFTHIRGTKITLGGNPAHDAKRYQERDVEKAVREVEK
jgi:predicted RNA binding protein YcfA (HicA-like mRNA interferase family)